MTHKTPVTTVTTIIKLLDEKNNDTVKHETVNGRLNNNECKQVAKDLDLTFVSKEVKKESFEVDTNDLLNLKPE